MPIRILIVDDAVDLVDTLARLLWRFGYTCLTASSAQRAKAIIDAEKPQLVVTDLHMPGMDGLTVARCARETVPPIPVILMTAYPSAESHARARTLGVTAYLPKPFANADFLKAVESALGGG